MNESWFANLHLLIFDKSISIKITFSSKETSTSNQEYFSWNSEGKAISTKNKELFCNNFYQEIFPQQ